MSKRTPPPWTPGPWEARSRRYFGTGDMVVYDVLSPEGLNIAAVTALAEDKHNARLLAAAPDLLAALDDLLAACTSHADHKRYRQALDISRAALRKAKGEA